MSILFQYLRSFSRLYVLFYCTRTWEAGVAPLGAALTPLHSARRTCFSVIDIFERSCTGKPLSLASLTEFFCISVWLCAGAEHAAGRGEDLSIHRLWSWCGHLSQQPHPGTSTNQTELMSVSNKGMRRAKHDEIIGSRLSRPVCSYSMSL